MDKNSKYLTLHKDLISVARLSICSNTLLLLLKLAAGFFMGSISVLSEALHSAIDLLAALIANYSISKASQPADNEHKFGHGKFENMSGTVEAILIFMAATIILFESGKKLLVGNKVEFIGTGIIIMGISALVNVIVGKKMMRVAKEAESIALTADAYHLTTDVYTSIGVFIGLILIKLTGNPIFDPIIAIIVALIIIKAAYDLTKCSIAGLMDVRLSDKEEGIIESIISEHSALGYHNLRTRMSGAERFVDLHLTVPKKQNITVAHKFCDHIEDDIKEKIPNLSITIHIEPCEIDCDVCDKIKFCKLEHLP